MKITIRWLKNSMAFHAPIIDFDELWQCENCGMERPICEMPDYVYRIQAVCPEGCGETWHKKVLR